MERELEKINILMSRKFNRTFDFFSVKNPFKQTIGTPIQLYDDREYEVGIKKFAVFDAINNIEENKNNEFRYSKDNGTIWKNIKIQSGSWEVKSLSNEIQRQLTIKGDWKENAIERAKPELPVVALGASMDTRRVELRLAPGYQVDFRDANSKNFRNLLGFNSEVYSKPFERAPNPARIDGSRSAIIIRCLQASGGFITDPNNSGRLTDKQILLSVPSFSVPMGSKIVVEPSNPIYLHLSTNTLNSFDFVIEDESGELYDFDGEEIFITLHVKQV